MKITEVTLYTVHGEWDSPDNRSGSRQAQMLDIYPEFNARDWAAGRNGGKRAISATYVEILSEEGVSGIFGPIELDQAFVDRKSVV